jgi:hypothetical protein
MDDALPILLEHQPSRKSMSHYVKWRSLGIASPGNLSGTQPLDLWHQLRQGGTNRADVFGTAVYCGDFIRLRGQPFNYSRKSICYTGDLIGFVQRAHRHVRQFLDGCENWLFLLA